MKTLQRQRGISAITAVVLIVLLALLGAYMATISGVQSLTTTLGTGAERARYAAGSGAEWAIYRVLNDDDCSNVAGQSLSINTGNGVSFAVDLGCDAVSVTETPDTYNIFHLTATAHSGGTAGDIGYVSRRVRVSVANPH